MYLNIGMLRYQVCNCQGRVLCVVVQQLILVLPLPDTDWVYNNLYSELCDSCWWNIFYSAV